MSKFGGHFSRENIFEVDLGDIFKEEYMRSDTSAVMDLRKYGTARHAGFGLGFERCVMYLTGMTNIRDVVPFPRTVKNCEL